MVNRLVTVFLCGDVMLGRGVDQILPHPGDPTLRETCVNDARAYVELAEAANGPIPRPVDFTWPWGEVLSILDHFEPDIRVINLETSITRSDAFAPRKAVHYRMNPDNVPCLTALHPDACALANNHVLDFGHPGLEETLTALSGAGLCAMGAGRDATEARRLVSCAVQRTVRVLVCSFGVASSGIPAAWAATTDRPGVDFLLDPSEAGAADITGRFEEVKRPGDIAVASIHWGYNWGYDLLPQEEHFAHQLIDGGVDIVHGHSSHHPRPIEIYRGKVVLYGCGDFVDDYEGITGYEDYRDDLRLLYLASVASDTGELADLRIVPMQARKMRLEHASGADSRWILAVLDRISRPFGTGVDLGRDGVITAHAR
jgi:poly-gamma-glutamate capsule biosynthesis protein CapA/YwtB (metallophosphatase superfamily)